MRANTVYPGPELKNKLQTLFTLPHESNLYAS